MGGRVKTFIHNNKRKSPGNANNEKGNGGKKGDGKKGKGKGGKVSGAPAVPEAAASAAIVTGLGLQPTKAQRPDPRRTRPRSGWMQGALSYLT